MMRGQRREGGQLPAPGESSLAGCPLPSSAAPAAAKLPTPKSGVTTPSNFRNTVIKSKPKKHIFGESVEYDS